MFDCGCLTIPSFTILEDYIAILVCLVTHMACSFCLLGELISVYMYHVPVAAEPGPVPPVPVAPDSLSQSNASPVLWTMSQKSDSNEQLYGRVSEDSHQNLS